MTAQAIVNRLLEANTRGLPPPVEAQVRELHASLVAASEALQSLTISSSLDERDAAVEALGPAAEGLDSILMNYRFQDFPALDWVLDALGRCRDELLELLNEDDWAKPEDAVIVQRVANTLEDLLQ